MNLNNLLKSTSREDFLLGLSLLEKENPGLFLYTSNTLIPSRLLSYLQKYCNYSSVEIPKIGLGEIEEYCIQMQLFKYESENKRTL